MGNPETSSRVMLSNVTQAKKTIKSEVDFALEIPSHIDERDLMVTVLGPGGEKAASQLDKGKDGKYHIIFAPNEQGQYKIYVRYRGERVEDTPYIVNLTDKVFRISINKGKNNNSPFSPNVIKVIHNSKSCLYLSVS